MARIFSDNLDGTAGTEVSASTPETGVDWTKVAAWGAGSLVLDGDATDGGCYSNTAASSGYIASPSPAAGVVTVGGTIARLSASNFGGPRFILRAHATDATGYHMRFNAGASARFELQRFATGSGSGVLKTWTGLSIPNPGTVDVEITIQDVGGSPVIELFWDGVSQGSFTDSDVSKIVEGSPHDNFGVEAGLSNNATATTGIHLRGLYIDDTSATSSPVNFDLPEVLTMQMGVGGVLGLETEGDEGTVPTVSIDQGDSTTVPNGKTRQLTASATGNPEPSLGWESDDELVATIGAATGLLETVGLGTCTITVTATNSEGFDTDTIEVTVAEPVAGNRSRRLLLLFGR